MIHFVNIYPNKKWFNYKGSNYGETNNDYDETFPGFEVLINKHVTNR